MRGTLHPIGRHLERMRFIPAYAGNTKSRSTPCPPPPVHPRVCGEHPGFSVRSYADSGSSPRMRGTRPRPHRPCQIGRFIPAYAGNTRRRFQRIHDLAVHPRVCGEHPRRHSEAAAYVGSSPRMRGTRFAGIMKFRIHRFIPAYAGNTIRIRKIPRREGGSSPRMRGTRYPSPDWANQVRFIPAYAGNTPLPMNARKQAAVHPRVCGEHVRTH